MEFLIKSFATGFCLAPHSYLRDGWNIFDFVLVILSIIDIFELIYGYSLGFMGALRVFRLIRFFRTVRLFPNLRQIFLMVLYSVPDMLRAIFLQMFCFIMAAIIGLNVFSGRQY